MLSLAGKQTGLNNGSRLSPACYSRLLLKPSLHLHLRHHHHHPDIQLHCYYFQIKYLSYNMSASTGTDPVDSKDSKAPVQPTPPAASGDGHLHVQPARLADLQPTYAQQIHHEDDANTAEHGWYGSLSKLTRLPQLHH